MNLIKLKHFEIFVFAYNLIAHMLLVTLYITFNKNINCIICNKNMSINYLYNIFFICGHLLISSVMMSRIPEEFRGTLPISIFGSIGHSLLFISCILSFLYGTKFDIFKFIFLISQIGMIYVYSIEYIIKDIYNMSKFEKIMFIIPLILLFIYYIYNFFHIKSPIKFGYITVSFVYLFLIIISYYQNKKQNYISIF